MTQRENRLRGQTEGRLNSSYTTCDLRKLLLAFSVFPWKQECNDLPYHQSWRERHVSHITSCLTRRGHSVSNTHVQLPALGLERDAAATGFRFLLMSREHGGPKYMLACLRGQQGKYCFNFVNPSVYDLTFSPDKVLSPSQRHANKIGIIFCHQVAVQDYSQLIISHSLLTKSTHSKVFTWLQKSKHSRLISVNMCFITCWFLYIFHKNYNLNCSKLTNEIPTPKR